MKKLKTLLVAILTLCLGFSLVGCKSGRLKTPEGFSLDGNSNLTWSVITNASGYEVSFLNVASAETSSRSVRRAKISLYSLTEGDYEIRVKAVAGKKGGSDSAWSEPFPFHKDYESGMVYSLINNNTEYEISSVGTASDDVVIEDEYRGKPVTSIGDGAFRGNSRVTSVVIGNNVTYIGESAFYNCSRLTSVTVPESVTTVGASAFQSCRNLTSLTLPDGVTEIHELTFAYCRNLASVTLGKNVVTIEKNAFRSCPALTSFVIPDSVTLLGEHAFNECTALKSVKIGAGIDTIARQVFYGCSALKSVEFSDAENLWLIDEEAFAQCTALEEIEIPEGVTNINLGAFRACSALSDISLPDSLLRMGSGTFAGSVPYTKAAERGEHLVFIDGWVVYADDAFKKTATEITPTTFPSGTVGIADTVFYKSEKLSSLEFSSDLKYVGNYAFLECPELYRLTVHGGLQIIGVQAFCYCGLFRNITFEDDCNLNKIMDYAFYGCELLSTCRIPDSVESVGRDAFKQTALWNEQANATDDDDYMNSDDNVWDNDDNPSGGTVANKVDGVIYAGNWVVGYASNKIAPNITLREDTRGIADYAFADCETIQNVTGVGIANARYIGEGAFQGCSRLASISLNDNVTKIKPFTFYGCSSLFRASLPANLQTVGKSAFYNCSRLSDLNFSGTSVSEIEDFAFFGCSNVKTLTFGRDIEKIGYCAFYNCSALESVSIPNSVTSLGERAFYGCEGLTSLTIGSGMIKIPEYAFGKCTSLESVTIPSTIGAIGNYAFYRSAGIKAVDFGSGVKTIGDYAFYGVTSLETMRIPENVTSIGKFAFRNCTGLTSVVLGSNLKEIGTYAFYGCRNLTFYTSASSDSVSWSGRWNASARPVLWGCTLSDDGSYVLSFTAGEGMASNVSERTVPVDPLRTGYHLVGWAAESGGEAVYATDEIAGLDAGKTVYAVWAEGEPEKPAEPEEPETPADAAA